MTEAEKTEDYTLLFENLRKISTLDESDKTTIMLPLPECCWDPHPGMLFHSNYEIFYQIDGGCRFIFPKEEKTIYPGEFLVVPPGTPHREHAFSLNGKKFCNLAFIISKKSFTLHIARSGVSGNRFDEPGPAYALRFESPNSKIPWPLATMIAERDSLTVKNNDRHLSRLRGLQTLAAVIIEETNNRSDDSREHYKIDMVKSLINSSAMNEMPTVSELGERVGLSANYLSWLFHKETGETLKGYINRTRIEQAENMLRTTTKSIAEIAWICGFRDPAYFSRIFERNNGRKPFEYRSKAI